MLRYIRDNFINEEDLKMSYFNYLRDNKISEFGLSDFDFYKLVYEKMVKDGEEKLAKNFAETWG